MSSLVAGFASNFLQKRQHVLDIGPGTKGPFSSPGNDANQQFRVIPERCHCLVKLPYCWYIDGVQCLWAIDGEGGNASFLLVLN